MQTKPDKLPPLPDWLKDYGPFEAIELSDRDAACMVLPDLDYDAQLMAIMELLKQRQRDDQETRKQIKDIEEFAKKTSGIRNEQAVDEWVSRLHHSVYQDAAHSMAAVGLLAPFIESIFYHAFQAIGQRVAETSSPPSEHRRWQRPAEDQWDCHFVWTNGRRRGDLVQGILQLADAVEMTKHLPSDLRQTLEALFAYRNKMFHCGFEWPVEERRRFEARLTESAWPSDWFSRATSGGEPWIFYMSETFVEHCLTTVEQLICGIGAFCNARFLSIPNQPDS